LCCEGHIQRVVVTLWLQLRKIEGDKTELLGDVVEVSCRGWQSKVDTMSVVGSAVINQPIQQCLNRVRGVPARRQDDAGVQLRATEACQPGDSDWVWCSSQYTQQPVFGRPRCW